MSSIITGRLPEDLGPITLKLYPLGSSAIANGAAGDTASEDAARPGYYEWSVAESITGIHDAFLIDLAGNLVAALQVNILVSSGSRYPLEEPANIPAEVWAHATRTLTMSAVAIEAIVSGSTLTLHRGDSLSEIAITGLGSLVGRSKLWLTVKRTVEHADSAAVLQIEETAGLVVLNGVAAATPANGDITVDDEVAGDILITLAAAETAKLAVKSGLVWDVQVLVSGVVRTLTSGEASVVADVTRATS